MYSYLFLYVIIIILFYIINFNLNKKNTEHFTESILFLRSDELLNILKKDDDNYYKTFFNNDFFSRKIKNIDHYMNYIELSVTEFNNDEKNKIISCIDEVNTIFNNLYFEWFDGKKANNILWKIGCIKGKLYEHGLPHTRGDIIVISKEKVNNYTKKKLIKTLIHEKIHIYQKIYPNDVNKYLIENKFYKIKKKDINDNIRANPDLDEWIYKDIKGNIYKAIYNDNPLSIEDITYSPKDNQSYEHPFEKMAIFIENYNN